MNPKNTHLASKNILRKKFLEARLALSSYDIRENSELVKITLLGLDIIKTSKNIGLYIDVNNEVETKELIKELVGQGKKIYLPKFDNNYWFYAEFLNWQEMEIGPFKIPQPVTNKKINIDILDVAILAGVAFSKKRPSVGVWKRCF